MMAESRGIFAPNAQTSRTTPPPNANDNGPSVSPPPPASSENVKSGLPSSISFPNNADLAQVTAKIESLKKWTVNTYKTTKHSINEQLGKIKRTVDKDLEERIEALRDLQRRYQEILASARGYTGHFLQANNMQRSLAEAMYQLSCKEDVLNNEFALHSEALRGLSQNGEILFRALNNYISALETMADKTIQDTLLTIDHHDQARLEYDVYRCELENLQIHPDANASIPQTEEKCSELKAKYEQLKEDVRVKLTLLEENRCKVMRRQIATIQQAFTAYFSGNLEALNAAMSNMNGGEVSTNSSFHDNDPMQPSSQNNYRTGQYTNARGGAMGGSFLEQ